MNNGIKNEMMDRPVVDERVLRFMREGQKPFTGHVRAIQEEAEKDRIPIIPEETAVFLRFLFSQISVHKVLEIGTAIGFSSSLMDDLMQGKGEVTTIDRFEYMIERAKVNFERYHLDERIQLLEGQAAELLPSLPSGYYDFVFMDSAKSKYIEFLPECLRLVKRKGIVMIDDVFQGGTVFDPDDSIRRGARKIHRRLKELLTVVNEVEGLTSCTLPLGDGVLLITKEEDDIQLPPLNE